MLLFWQQTPKSQLYEAELGEKIELHSQRWPFKNSSRKHPLNLSMLTDEEHTFS